MCAQPTLCADVGVLKNTSLGPRAARAALGPRAARAAQALLFRARGRGQQLGSGSQGGNDMGCLRTARPPPAHPFDTHRAHGIRSGGGPAASVKHAGCRRRLPPWAKLALAHHSHATGYHHTGPPHTLQSIARFVCPPLVVPLRRGLRGTGTAGAALRRGLSVNRWCVVVVSGREDWGGTTPRRWAGVAWWVHPRSLPWDGRHRAVFTCLAALATYACSAHKDRCCRCLTQHRL